MGVNDDLRPEHRIVSNASSTVHAGRRSWRSSTTPSASSACSSRPSTPTRNQHRLADVPAEDKRRGRAAAENIIPQESRSPEVLMGLLPELSGQLTGYAMNVPVSNGSVVDLVCWHERPVTVEAINEVVRTAAASARWKDILEYENEPIVSSDVLLALLGDLRRLATMTLGTSLEDAVLVRLRLRVRAPRRRPRRALREAGRRRRR